MKMPMVPLSMLRTLRIWLHVCMPCGLSWHVDCSHRMSKAVR